MDENPDNLVKPLVEEENRLENTMSIHLLMAADDFHHPNKPIWCRLGMQESTLVIAETFHLHFSQIFWRKLVG